MPYKVASPHDNYFCGIMEVREVARSFFMAHLPSPLVKELDWDTLQIAESARRLLGSKTKHTDITYACNIKKEGIPIFLHAEQQRTVDNTMVERILRYNLALYSRHRKQGHKKLPIVVNILVYNNTKPRNYPYSDHICDYFEVPRIAQMLSDRYFYLINLNKEADETLASHGPSGAMELLLKRAWDSNFIKWLKSHGSLLGDMAISDIFILSINYALEVGKDEAEDIIEAFLAIYPQQKDNIMTAARQLERKGREEERQEVARNMLFNLHLDIDTVQKATKLTKDKLQEILKRYYYSTHT